MKENPGTYKWERMTHSQVLSLTPVFIGTVIVTPHVGKRGIVRVYDGESAQDPLMITVATGAGITKVINLHPYMVTQRGLYIEFVGDIDEALVYYHWERD